MTPELNCPSTPGPGAINRAARAKVVQCRLMLGRIGIPELIIILMIIILIFGANRLPEIGRGIGKGIRNFKDATKDGENNPS